ncbi:MAG: MFS transporter [Alphaproteobacteria bacterium]|nr:MFS transporter [Alphaproteobacteria bacterium]MBU0795439.1 MFS transporter [Alphaproteobacteria bacterium]MBU0876606.1 MFS transporter [Alphaproteobacteria bacterium]MBU1769307.1 MFS transporter [Alphaproteobacteria bacterium]
MSAASGLREGAPGSSAASLGGWALAVLASFSLLNFLGFASTFSALGVTLPYMVGELGWSWTQAGLGFTLLGVASASSSFLPALLIRRYGVRAPLVLGAFVLASGLLLLSRAQGVLPFFLGTITCGIGFQLIAMIPGTHVLSGMFSRRSLVFGIYMTSGSLGGVAGPWIVLSTMAGFEQDWRMVWIVLACAIFVTSLTCALIVGKGSDTHRRHQESGTAPIIEERGWAVRDALRTPQFWMICGAYLSQLLVLSCVSSMSVAHLTQTGVVATVAAGMLSLEAAVQVAARLLGGALGEIVNRRLLLICGLACATIGVWTLSGAQSTQALLIYALLTGIGVGLTALSSTLLLLEWFGKKHNLELFSIICTLVAISSFNSLIGGAIRDATGSFALAFQLFGCVPALVLIASLLIRRPHQHGDHA